MFPVKLRREIVLLLCAKAILLVAIYQLFFAPIERPEPDGPAMGAHFFATNGR
jgi:hypothetical protein